MTVREDEERLGLLSDMSENAAFCAMNMAVLAAPPKEWQEGRGV